VLRLWQFSLAYYAVPGVPRACLWLQDHCGVDVNLLMFSAWAGYGCGVATGRQDLAHAETLVRDWRAGVVEPLRAARRALKGESLARFHAESPSLRLRVKDLELQAERLEQEHLERFLLARTEIREPSVELASNNLAEFLAPADGAAEAHLYQLQTALRAL